MPARLHQLVRPGGFGEREGLVDDRLDPAALDERPDLRAQVFRDRALEFDRARAQGRARDGQPPAQDLGEVDGRFGAAEEGDHGDAAVVGEAFQLAIDVVAPDHVEDDVHPFAAGRLFHGRGEVLGPVVDGAVGAELHAFRDRQALRRGRGAVLGVAAALHERGRRIADAPVFYAVADRDDAAGELEARYVGRPWRNRIVAHALQHVGAVDAGCRDADQYFAGPGLRNGARSGLEHLGLPRLGDLDRAHGFREGHAGQPQTLFDTSSTRPSFLHWSSAVSLLPWWVLEKPHCGERHRFSRGTYFAAAS